MKKCKNKTKKTSDPFNKNILVHFEFLRVFLYRNPLKFKSNQCLDFFFVFLFFIFSSFTPSLVYGSNENSKSTSTKLCEKPLEIQQAVLEQLGDHLDCNHVTPEELEAITSLQIDRSDLQIEVEEDFSMETDLAMTLLSPDNRQRKQKTLQTLQSLFRDFPSLIELRIKFNSEIYQGPKVNRKIPLVKKKKTPGRFIQDVANIDLDNLDFFMDFEREKIYVNYNISF